jgi:uncharacterized HAD superfamily protein
VGIDLDGVVVDFNLAFLHTASKKFNVLHNVTRKDVVTYDYWDCPNIPITKEKCFEIVDYVLENPVECGVTIISGAEEVLTSLSEHMDLFFLTARREKFKEQTKELVYSVLPDVDKNKITILHESGRKKYKILKDLDINYFIDDKLTTCRSLEQNGIKTILFKSPWNATNEPFYRTNCWSEISDFIFEEVIKK